MAVLDSNSIDDNMSVITNFSRSYDTEWDESMWNLVVEDFHQSQFKHKETGTIVLIVLYVPIFVMSLVGNALVLLVIVPNRRMWSVTNNFLVNLAVADLLVTVLCMPMTLARKVYEPWIYGEVLCKMTPYLQGVSVTSSTFTITAMSLDRCLAILHPMKFRSLRTKSNVRILIVVVWVTSMMLMLPLVFVNKIQTQKIFEVITVTRCLEEWMSLFQRRAYDFSLLFIICLIPAQIVFMSYILMGKRLWFTDSQLKGSEETKIIHSGSASQKKGGDTVRANRRRIAKMCIVVSIVFVVCWLPHYTVTIYLDYKRDNSAFNIVYWALLVGHLHCITNPILYCFMHKTFRHCVKRLLPCWRTRFLRTQSAYGTSAFTRYRMTSFVTSSKSKSTTSTRKPDSRVNQEPAAACAGQSDPDPNPGCLKTTDTSDISACKSSECSKTNDDTPRRVQLILSRIRDKTLSSKKLNAFKLIELPDSAKDEGHSQSISDVKM